MPHLKRFTTMLMATAILIACGGENSQTTPVEEKPIVALVVKSLANEFFVNMADSAREHQAANAEDYELIVNGLKDENDLSQQVTLLEQMTGG